MAPDPRKTSLRGYEKCSRRRGFGRLCYTGDVMNTFSPPSRRPWVALLGPVALLVGGCGGDERAAPPSGSSIPGGSAAARRGAPPPTASARSGVCEGGGGIIKDEATAKLVPRRTSDFCLDPNEPARTFGEGGDRPLDDICNLFDGECDVYKGFRVLRVAQVRWVPGAGGSATIDGYVSRFASPEDAYGMFTKRVVGDGDPADPATPGPIAGGGAAALGIGNALLWRGAHLVELTLNDDTAAEAALRAAGSRLLTPLVKEIGAALPGETELPEAARLLPAEGQLPMGIRWVRGPLWTPARGATDGAFGYYAEGKRRHRVAIITRGDEAQAKDVMRSIAEIPGAKKEKGLGDEAVIAAVEESKGLAAEWVFARKGAKIVAVGDEVRVLTAGESPDERAAKTLDRAAKIERLKKLL